MKRGRTSVMHLASSMGAAAYAIAKLSEGVDETNGTRHSFRQHPVRGRRQEVATATGAGSPLTPELAP